MQEFDENTASVSLPPRQNTMRIFKGDNLANIGLCPSSLQTMNDERVVPSKWPSQQDLLWAQF